MTNKEKYQTAKGLRIQMEKKIEGYAEIIRKFSKEKAFTKKAIQQALTENRILDAQEDMNQLSEIEEKLQKANARMLQKYEELAFLEDEEEQAKNEWPEEEENGEE